MSLITNGVLGLREYCKTLQNNVLENSELIEPANTPDGVFYHISTARPDENNQFIYTPKISQRAAPSEDRTTPRVTVAPTLEGCMVGYNTLSSLSDTIVNKDAKAKNPYLGGLYIYELPFEAALRPNKNLVFDADRSGECWLVPYDQNHKQYIGTCVGKLFPVSKSKVLWENDRTEAIEFVLEVLKDKLTVCDLVTVTKGYSEFKFIGNKSYYPGNNLTEEEYRARKNRSASLLNYTEPTGSLIINRW